MVREFAILTKVPMSTECPAPGVYVYGLQCVCPLLTVPNMPALTWIG